MKEVWLEVLCKSQFFAQLLRVQLHVQHQKGANKCRQFLVTKAHMGQLLM